MLCGAWLKFAWSIQRTGIAELATWGSWPSTYFIV